MSRTIVLLILAAAMLIVSILTWGSLGSAVLVFCLIIMAAALLYQHFLTNRDEDSFRDDQ